MLKKEGDLFKVLPEKVREVGDNLEFDWIVGRNAVAYKGTVIFNVCMKKIQVRRYLWLIRNSIPL